jgi:GNAT superfamily N-acetyltransferase
MHHRLFVFSSSSCTQTASAPSIGVACATVPGLVFRFATVEDTASLVELIAELAHSKGVESSVTTDGLSKTLFGDRVLAEVVIAVHNGHIAGLACFRHNFSTCLGKPGLFVEDLFVRPASRNRGIGTAFMEYLASIANERDCGRFEWAVNRTDAPAIAFYQSLGATMMDEWLGFVVSGPAHAQLCERFSTSITV